MKNKKPSLAKRRFSGGCIIEINLGEVKIGISENKDGNMRVFDGNDLADKVKDIIIPLIANNAVH